MKEDLDKIYSLRDSFSIIGLTGRTGSGVTDVADIVSDKFSKIEKIQPLKTGEKLNNQNRRYNISFNFAKKNWKVYMRINYRDIILLHVLKDEIANLKLFLDQHYSVVSDEIITILDRHKKIIQKIKATDDISRKLTKKKKLKNLAFIFFSPEFIKLSNELNEALNLKYPVEKIQILHQIANNLRRNGSCYNSETTGDVHIYFLAETINRIIKGYKLQNNETHIIIDSLRNSLEIMFFKERFSAFYMIAVNSDNRRKFLNDRYNEDENIVDKILEIDKEEYEGNGITVGEFHKQDVQNCIQKSDIYFNNNPVLELRNQDFDLNELKKKSKYYLVGQVIRYTGLILHPGLITPSAQERCMQIAYNAKSNSGCISRQVGAAITDENFSIKSIGWNDVPNNATPCLLRSVQNLNNNKDLIAYSPYEKDNKKYSFNNKFKEYYKDIDDNSLNGLNCSFCFKDFHNLIELKENQVHTRSLHAEENAMLQVSKYGGQPLKKGVLFTTASPCELCAKKARQLEIKEIYYIDPYPGISNWHILRDGLDTPSLILFSGAVGRAYHKLYEPFMSYKDELALITNKRPKVDMKNALQKKYRM